MKVIFLDHDGVICLSSEWGSRFKKQKKWGGRKLSMSNSEVPLEYRFDNFNKKTIKTLNEILEKTNAEIVISSDWRFHASLIELQVYYKQQGILKTPFSMTQSVKQIDERIWNKQFRNYANLEQERAFEIQDWLKKNPEVTSWVAVDDLNMGLFLGENFVWTPKENEGLKQNNIKEKIIKILNREI